MNKMFNKLLTDKKVLSVISRHQCDMVSLVRAAAEESHEDVLVKGLRYLELPEEVVEVASLAGIVSAAEYVRERVSDGAPFKRGSDWGENPWNEIAATFVVAVFIAPHL